MLSYHECMKKKKNIGDMIMKASKNHFHHQLLIAMNHILTSLEHNSDALTRHDYVSPEGLVRYILKLIFVHAATTQGNATDCSSQK